MRHAKNRNVTNESITEPKGQQISLSDTPKCSTKHNELRQKHGLQKCPNCGQILNNRQTRLTDYK